MIDPISGYDLASTLTSSSFRRKYLLSLGGSLASLRYPKFFGESTPSYLLYGDQVARRVQTLYPSIRLIVMLRDPVQRAYSHYRMTSDPHGTPSQLKARKSVRGKSFATVVEEDLQQLEGIHPDSDPEEFQRYADQLPRHHGCHGYVGRGLYAFQLEQWYKVFPREQILVVTLDAMHTERGIQHCAQRAFDFIGLSPYDVPKKRPRNVREYDEAIDARLETRLREYYAPFNRRLSQLLGFDLPAWRAGE